MKTPTGKNMQIDLDEDAIDAVKETLIDEDGRTSSALIEGDIIDEDANPLDKLPREAIRNDDGSVTLPLYYPKTLTTKKDGKVREREFASLTFHRLNGADQRAISAAEEKDLAVVSFARSTRFNQAVMNALFDKMDAADIANGGRVLNHFLTSGPKTGR
jgi:hypothetical protein